MTWIKRLKWVWLVLFWCVAFAVLMEASLRLFPSILPQQLREIAYTVINGTPFAEDWHIAWVRNPDHYYIVKPGLVDALQYGSPSVSFHINTYELWEHGGIGFRNRPVDYFVDAVVIGDSFTFCFTEYEDCWVTLLGQQTGMGMVNLGQPATGTNSHYMILEGFGQPYNPPLVIWQFFGNDFNDDYGLLTYRGDIEPIEEDVDKTPEVTNSLGMDTSGLIGWLRENSVAYSVLEVAITGLRGGVVPNDSQFTERYEVTLDNGQRLSFGQPYEPHALDMERQVNQIGRDASRESFRKAHELVQTWGGQLAVVIIPTREQVYAAYTADALRDDLDKIDSARLAMLDICAELDLICYDPLGDLQAVATEGEMLYYYDDMHLNPYGNHVFADLMQAWLDEQGLLP